MRKNGKELEIPNLHNKTPLNHVSRYLLPALELKNTALDYKYFREQGFVNGFLGYDQDYMDFRDSLFLLFNPSLDKLQNWNDFYELYTKERRFVGEYDLNINTVLLIFRLPEKYKLLPKFLLEGKYSKFPKEYANKFIISHSGDKIKALHEYLVMTRNHALRCQIEDSLGEPLGNAELESKPEKETLYLKLKDVI